jgi:hypothetical protein
MHAVTGIAFETIASAAPKQLGLPQAPQLAPGNVESTASTLGSTST